MCRNYFKQENSYDARYNREWEVSKVKTVNIGTETIRYRGSKTWKLSPDELKGSSSLFEFKRKSKEWKPQFFT